jgi:hypothetical protein
MLLSSPSVYIKDTGTAKGRGVYAARPFAAGELVEACPVIILDKPFPELPQAIKNVAFNWEVLAGAAPGTHCVSLGYGGMYNHDNPANMRYEADPVNVLLRYIAVRAISVDEELTVNYNARGGGAEWFDDNWFERMQLKPIVGR